MSDWSESWLKAKKALANIEAAMVLDNKVVAEDEAAALRIAATDILLAVRTTRKFEAPEA